MPIKARTRRSTLTPVGMNSGSITEAMNNTVIKGTPRQNSIKTTQKLLTIGICERRPSANKMPIGKAPVMPTTASTRVSISPPQRWVSTTGRPKYPP